MVRLKDAYSVSQGELVKRATTPTSILPKEAEDLDESNATSLLEGGSDDRRYNGFDDIEDEVEVAGESKEPTAKVVSAGMGGVSALKGDAKELVSSKKYDIDKVAKLSNKQRADLMSNILGKKVSSMESSKIASEIKLAIFNEGLAEAFKKVEKRVGKGMEQAGRLYAMPSGLSGI